MHPLRCALVAACALVVALSAQAAFSPARFSSGTVPPLPAMVVGGGQVFLELSVSDEGRVTAVKPLRTTPPFTELMDRAVRGWQFLPAEVEVDPDPGRPANPRPRERIASKVLAVGAFRPPALDGPTFGDAPKDVASASDETPAPLKTSLPPYALNAFMPGVVLVEVRVDPSGTVGDATVIRSAPPFDDLARAAAREWRFRPARVRGESVDTRAYIVFGFAAPTAFGQPTTGGGPIGRPKPPPPSEPQPKN